MIDNLYNGRILEFAGNIPRTERLEDPDATVTVVSRLCGSKVTLDLNLEGDVVSDFAHDVKACALGQCASSIMARHVVGSTVEELCELQQTMRAMLKENGPPPSGKWADLAILEPVRDYKGRHTSVMLTFDGVMKAIDEINAGQADAPKT
jgi:NifU-like protein involved in Fe-S cluster formation